ncbi:unnamed protein product [Blepharisma stoltei]|uniref:Uncharacterized protein n=1 Tax=Blepharisma stoltei TaxID=1481888 RepID=A0AAU9KEA0_9CILI|nr:unnamed protein product [Blepharisma stoltei]
MEGSDSEDSFSPFFEGNRASYEEFFEIFLRSHRYDDDLLEELELLFDDSDSENFIGDKDWDEKVGEIEEISFTIEDKILETINRMEGVILDCDEVIQVLDCTNFEITELAPQKNLTQKLKDDDLDKEDLENEYKDKLKEDFEEEYKDKLRRSKFIRKLKLKSDSNLIRNTKLRSDSKLTRKIKCRPDSNINRKLRFKSELRIMESRKFRSDSEIRKITDYMGSKNFTKILF